jgi:hypothetical protein
MGISAAAELALVDALLRTWQNAAMNAFKCIVKSNLA